MNTSFRIGACDNKNYGRTREANFPFFLIFLIRRLYSLREQRNRQRRRILRFPMLNRMKIRRRQQTSLLPALIMATTEEIMPGYVAHVQRFWTISGIQLWFETQQVRYFEVTSRFIILFSLPDRQICHYLLAYSMLQASVVSTLLEADVGPFELLNVRQVLTLFPKSEVTLECIL